MRGAATLATLNVADIFPARRLFTFSALLGAAANLSLLFAPSFGTVLLSRFATGLFLAGVYPPAMKMISTLEARLGQDRLMWFLRHVVSPFMSDVIVDRFQRFTGEKGVLERTGKSPLPLKPREEAMR